MYHRWIVGGEVPVSPGRPLISPMVVITVIGGCLLGLLGWRLGGAPDQLAAPVAVPTVEQQVPGSLIVVHLTGAVAQPGLVTVPAGSRIADVVMAAGGFLPGADVGAVNLAAPVTDGQQLTVGTTGGTGSAPTVEDELIAINRATAEELEDLPGVGPVLAARIVAHREENGPFKVVEDLLAVTGIGERMLASLRDLVRVP